MRSVVWRRATAPSQVDRAGEVLRADPTDAQALEVLEWWRSEHAEQHLAAKAALNELAALHDWLDAEVTSRLKKSDQIIRKLRASRTRLSTMDDLAGCRLVLGSLSEATFAVALITARLDVRAIKDTTARPTPVGYRAVHLLTRVNDRRVEIQVRTRRQHAWAAMVEAHDRETHDDAKHGHAPESVIAELFAMSEILSTLDQQDP